MYPHRGEPRLPFHVHLALARRATELKASGMIYKQIAAELGISKTSAARLVLWLRDSEAVGALTRRKRLPMRWSRAWNQANFDRLVAERKKMLELIAVDETLKDLAEDTRTATKSEKDTAREWLAAGAPPESAPVWLKRAIGEL